MNLLKYKGKHIRVSDKSLVFRFSAGSLFLLFLAVIMLLNLKSILTTDWKSVSFLQDGNVHLVVTPYRIVTIVVAALVCVLAALFYRRFQYDRVKQLFHRQKLARMLLENGWYESESAQDSGFFKDLPATTKKEKITYFPKVYYRMEHGLIYIRTEITLGKYQEQLLHLEKKLETGLYCELVSKELKDSYVEYVLLYDTIANRITINEVQAEHGSLRLMKNVWWEYDKLPHMLIAGGTGGGKTYFILTIIEALLRSNAVMYILDPKNADLADLSVVMPEVWYKKEDITACIDRFYDGMMARSEAIESMTDYDFAHLLFSDGDVEQSISLDRQLNIIQVADLVLPDKDTKFEEYTTMELLSVAMLIVISTFALDFIHSDRSIFKMVDLDEAWTFLQVAQGKALSNKLIRAGRSMNAAVYFVTQNSGDVDDEKMKNNIGLKFAFRSTDIKEIKNTLEFFGVDKEDEGNQKRLRDLENGQCLFQDLYGRVGVIQIHPVFADLFHAFDTRPPVQTEEMR